jgi:hypothetical protein
MNGLTHGLSAKVVVIPSENPAEYDARLLGVANAVQPQSTVEEILVHQIASASWQSDRAVRVESAHVAAIIENAAKRELEEVHSLANRLFATRGELPIEIWGTIEWKHIGPRPSHPPVSDDPEDPAKIVRELESSVAGCQWMIERFTELRELLEPGSAWEGHHKLKYVRLLGRRPLDVANRFDIALAFVAAWAINPVLDDAYSELRCELGQLEYERFTSLVRRTWEKKMINTVDPTNARRVLISLVEQAIARVKAKADLARERALRNAERTADCLSIDTSREGELIRRYENAANRKPNRAVADLVKIRRAKADGYFEPSAEAREGAHYESRGAEEQFRMPESDPDHREPTAADDGYYDQQHDDDCYDRHTAYDREDRQDGDGCDQHSGEVHDHLQSDNHPSADEHERCPAVIAMADSDIVLASLDPGRDDPIRILQTEPDLGDEHHSRQHLVSPPPEDGQLASQQFVSPPTGDGQLARQHFVSPPSGYKHFVSEHLGSPPPGDVHRARAHEPPHDEPMVEHERFRAPSDPAIVTPFTQSGFSELCAQKNDELDE